MSQRIIYQQDNGVVAVVVPAPGVSIEDIAETDVPEGREFKIIDESELPADRIYRDAWTADLAAGKVSIDMARARDIQRNAIRAAREPALAALDIEAMRAAETGDTAKAQDVTKWKEALRNAPADPRIEAATTPGELRNVWPEGLGDNPMAGQPV